jgi:hypothetical protein
MSDMLNVPDQGAKSTPAMGGNESLARAFPVLRVAAAALVLADEALSGSAR